MSEVSGRNPEEKDHDLKIRQWAYDNILLVLEGLNDMDQSLLGEEQKQIYTKLFGAVHLEMSKMHLKADYIPTMEVLNYLRDLHIKLTDYLFNKKQGNLSGYK